MRKLSNLRDEKIISFSRQNLSYSERYFAEKFEEHDLTDNVTYTCDDTFSLLSLVSAGLGIGFVPEWRQDLPNRGFELRQVRGVDFKIGLGVAGTGKTRPPRVTTSSISQGHWRGRAGEGAGYQAVVR